MSKINTSGNQEKHLVPGKASVFFPAIFRARTQGSNTYNIHKKKKMWQNTFFFFLTQLNRCLCVEAEGWYSWACNNSGCISWEPRSKKPLDSELQDARSSPRNRFTMRADSTELRLKRRGYDCSTKPYKFSQRRIDLIKNGWKKKRGTWWKEVFSMLSSWIS